MLNDKIWGKDNKIIPIVREKLLVLTKKIMSEFPNSINIKHIYFTGSLATYKWTPTSDIDLHIIIDGFDNSCEDVTKEYFNLTCKIFNSQHNIFIKGYKVEVSIKDQEKMFKDKAVYDLLKNEWVKEPSLVTRNLDDEEVVQKSKHYENRIEDLISRNASPEEAKVLKKEIKSLRNDGFDVGEGEYSVGNLIFKRLRNTGYLGRLFDYYNSTEDKNLSLEKFTFKKYINTSL